MDIAIDFSYYNDLVDIEDRLDVLRVMHVHVRCI